MCNPAARRLSISMAVFLLLSASILPFISTALDNPHNINNTVNCGNCHTANPPAGWWTDQDDGTNGVCGQCHNSAGPGSDAKTHSSTNTSTQYGTWDKKCTECHNPHTQQQNRIYKAESYLYTGISTAVTSSTVTKTGAGWTTDQWAGMILVPNVSYQSFNYRILSNTAETITIDTGGGDAIKLTYIKPGQTFGIVYGKLIKDAINGMRVRFFRQTGSKSFADGDGTIDGVCEVCHTKTTHFRNDGNAPDQLHSNVGGAGEANCITCHSHVSGLGHGGGSCGTSECHATEGSHPTHVSGSQLSLQCSECHDTSNFPQFKDGANSKDTTTVCNNCHSSNGITLAKQYWDYPGSSSQTPGSWTAVEGEKSFCGSCHDSTPGNTKSDGTGDNAYNILGNDSSYGYYVTGHGKTSGNYPRLSWQDTSAAGNPGANRQCSACHNLTTQHFNTAVKRLKSSYENDNNDSNCKQCHNPGTVAVADPQWYTTYTAYQNSAHSSKKCSDCHDMHGISGPYAGMTKANKENLCNNCHAGHAGHALGASFGQGGKSYSLQCVSCHNVHIVTGMFSASASDESPITKLSDNLNVWGAQSPQKMNDYAGSGTYKTPNGDVLSGSQLPDYPSFCLDCHGGDMSPSSYGSISWDGDQHGRSSANQPDGYGVCPNWFACGNAFGWDNDDCVGTQAECWPVKPRGDSDELYSRAPYTHTERIAGANLVLSCSDCHVTHESGIGSKLRATVNNSPGSTVWNTECNACHYYYSDWHAGMACGNASCHETNSIHRAKKMSGSGGTRTHTQGLVLYYAFENNLKDSGGWEMDGKWYSTSGSFAAGKSGQAVVLGEDIGVQVGTENSYWSTDEGNHGTWKYTEMKFNTSFEAWVYPTDNAKSEYTIFNKHVGVSNNGGYSLTLRKIGGTLRATFTMAADNNGVTQDGRAGVRGAYSSVAVPLNKWTHVAATFDTGGPDRNLSEPSIGRIRIYVNGEDVTTSDTSGNNVQPGANETSIYAYSENSPWNESICYNGTWCASEFSIGGFDWEATNFIGRIDEAKVWNITKNAAYFSSYDSQTAPYISSVEGLIGNNQLTITFSEGVYTNTGADGALVPADLTLTDTGGNNPRTITGVTHTAGASTAVITMSQPLTANDVNSDTLAAVADSIFDNYNNSMRTEAVTMGLSAQCPTSPVSIQLNEVSGSTYIMDTQNILYGAVYGGSATLTGSEYSGGGDGSGRYIMFDYNTSCLQASTAMTIEARIKPTGLSTVTGDTQYIRRILARDGSGNFQISVWRNNTWNNPTTDTYNAPDYEASIALWIYADDAHSGNSWKPVLTNYTGAKNDAENDCPIVNDHWYQIKAVWDTNKPGGTPGQFFQPADIFIEDQGTDGLGADKKWSGSINCTDTDQSLKFDAVKFYAGDKIKTYSGDNFAIGANRTNPANNLFNGLIDWIMWKAGID
ncbi:MAG: cytochrome c3 family protein [Nitrospirae bacterium]|nr:cytochrome c3 family protein [Nitrospirota bacterium]